jgi:hypothetical protein
MTESASGEGAIAASIAYASLPQRSRRVMVGLMPYPARYLRRSRTVGVKEEDLT